MNRRFNVCGSGLGKLTYEPFTKTVVLQDLIVKMKSKLIRQTPFLGMVSADYGVSYK